MSPYTTLRSPGADNVDNNNSIATGNGGSLTTVVDNSSSIFKSFDQPPAIAEAELEFEKEFLLLEQLALSR